MVVARSEELKLWTKGDPGFASSLQAAGARTYFAESLDAGDPVVGARAVLQRAYAKERVHVPEGNKYVAEKLRQLEEGGGLNALLADWIAEVNLTAVPYTARVMKSRQELDNEIAGRESKHQVVGATVARGKDLLSLADQRYVKRNVEAEALPQGHPALTSPSYIAGSDPKAEKRALRRR